LATVRPWLLLVLVVAAVSGAFALAGLPSPLLFGGLVGGLVHALALPRMRVEPPRLLFVAGQAIIGVTVGASIDWGTLRDLGWDWPAVVAVTVATLALSVLVGQLLRLHRGTSAVTASFAAVAGGASGMTALSRDLGADDRVVTVIQYLRVLVILLAMPAVVTIGFGAEQSDPALTVSAGWDDAGFAALAVVLGLVLGRVLHLPSPAVLGGLLATILLLLLPVFEGAVVPTAVQGAGFLLVGVDVGLRFTASSLRAIGRMLPTALLVIALIIVACAGLGVLLSEVTGTSRLDGYLATTPGGLYAVLATAAGTDADVTFVSAVQMLRLLLVLLAAPLLARLLRRR
jgi:membrane AbrB-like protein